MDPKEGSLRLKLHQQSTWLGYRERVGSKGRWLGGSEAYSLHAYPRLYATPRCAVRTDSGAADANACNFYRSNQQNQKKNEAFLCSEVWVVLLSSRSVRVQKRHVWYMKKTAITSQKTTKTHRKILRDDREIHPLIQDFSDDKGISSTTTVE